MDMWYPINLNGKEEKENMKTVKLSVLGCFSKLREVKNINYLKRTDSRYHYIEKLFTV